MGLNLSAFFVSCRLLFDDCLPAVPRSCDILPMVLLALVALWPEKAASAMNHATFPVLLLLMQ